MTQPITTPATDVRQALAAELHRIADDIVRLGLPLAETMSASLRLGVLDSRADLETWAAYLGTTLDRPDSTGIPSVTSRIPLRQGSRWPELVIGAQSGREASEVEALRAELAALKAQQAGGAR